MSTSRVQSTPPQPGREPVPEQAWLDLHAALTGWARALEVRWRDPQFFLVGSAAADHDLEFTTTAAPGAATTPLAKNLVRGANGVEVKVERRRDWNAPPRLYDAMAEFALSSLGGPTPTSAQQAARDAHRAVGDIADTHPELRRAVMRVALGPFAAEGSDERQGGAFSDRTTVQVVIGHLFERVLRKAGLSPTQLSTARIDDAQIRDTVDRLRASVGAAEHSYEVIALLNCPVIDARMPVRVWDGRWDGSECYLELGYPDDSLCASILQGLGYDFIQRDSHLDHLNCYVRFVYSLSAESTSSQQLQTHWSAEAFLRDAVDAVRIVFEGDVGILHVTGRSVSQDDLLLNPPFLSIFQEHPRSIQRTPLRRVYDPPPTIALAPEALSPVGSLFQRIAVDRIDVPGLPVALDRLRGVFERYAPEETGRLVDAMTGLEALFLSDGAQTELKHRLQLRAAKLLESDVVKRVAFARTFSKAYDLRSKVVHTGSLGSVKEADATDLQRFAVGALRAALRFFIDSNFALNKTPGQMSDVWLTFMLSPETGTPSTSATPSGGSD